MKLKEALKRIEDLEARIAALESDRHIHVHHWHNRVNPINIDPIRYEPFPVTCMSEGASLDSQSPGFRACGVGAVVKS